MTSPAEMVIKLRVIGNVPYLEERSPANPASQPSPLDMRPVLVQGERPEPDGTGGTPQAEADADGGELLGRDNRWDLKALAT